MKKNLLLLLILLGSTCWVFAQHDNLTNVSTEYMRMGCRTAALDAADLVVYNPAGLVHLENGFHINIGNQTFFRKPTHAFTLPGGTAKEYQQESPDYYLPNIYLAYKHNKWAAFGGFYISGGGGSLDYPDGSVNTDLIITQMMLGGFNNFYGDATSFIDASSFYMTPIVGFSYAITPQLSAAASFRYIMATNKQKANVTFTDPKIPEELIPVPSVYDLEYDETASGIGFAVGLDYKVSDNFNLAARYESNAALEFETDSIVDGFGVIGQPVIHDGDLRQRDLPGSASLGAGFYLTDNFSAAVDFSWYFQKMANWDTDTKGTEWSEVAGDVARVALGLGYDIGESLTANLWGGYTMYMYDDDASLYAPYDGGKSYYYTKLGVFETIKDDNFSIGLGAKYQISRAFNVNLAFVQTFWPKDVIVTEVFPAPPTYPTFDVTTNNSVSTIAIGVNLLFGGE